MAKQDFLISYCRSDEAWALWIAAALARVGYSTRLQAADFRPEGNFTADLDQAAEEAERTLAVLSPHYLTPLAGHPEWTAALVQGPTGAGRKLLSVRVAPCEPQGPLRALGFLDLVGLTDPAAAAGRLQEALDGQPLPPSRPAEGLPEPPPFPGAPPPVWQVPHARNPYFTGREALLTQLRDSLTAGRPTALTPARPDPGATGKTQLAVEYVYRYASEYDVVWWVRAAGPIQLASELAGLARALHLPGAGDRKQRVALAAVRRWLPRNGRWLLIFDHAPHPEALKDYLPRGRAGHVLITSSHSDWGEAAVSLPVPAFTREESIGLVSRRTGRADPGAPALAAALDDLPLAVSQAAGHLEATGLTAADYLPLLRSRLPESATRDPRRVMEAVWSLALTELQQSCPGAADLLRLCAHLAPDDLPLEVLRAHPKALPSALAVVLKEEAVLDRVLTTVRRHGLLEGREVLCVHRLLQAVVRAGMTPAEHRRWTEAALRTLSEALTFEASDTAKRSEAPRLLPHALAAAGLAAEQGLAPDATARLLHRVGVLLRERAEFAAARSVLEGALAVTERAHGPEHPSVAIRLNNLGNVLQDMGDLTGARAHYARALAIDEKVKGPDDPAVGVHLSNLGSVLEALGDLAGARAHYQRALAISEQALGPDHPQVASRLGNLGNVLRALGEAAAGRPYLERALLIEEQAHGPDHPTVALRASHLGRVLHELRDLEAAQAHYARAVAVGEQAYGPQHPAVAGYRNGLGSVLEDQGDLEAARENYARALAIDEKVYGPNHSTVATDLNNLGSVLNALGDLPGALSHAERALVILEKTHGPNHTRVAASLYNLGCVHANIDDIATARVLLARAQRIFEEALGTGHPSTVATREALASLSERGL